MGNIPSTPTLERMRREELKVRFYDSFTNIVNRDYFEYLGEMLEKHSRDYEPIRGHVEDIRYIFRPQSLFSREKRSLSQLRGKLLSFEYVMLKFVQEHGYQCSGVNRRGLSGMFGLIVSVNIRYNDDWVLFLLMMHFLLGQDFNFKRALEFIEENLPPENPARKMCSYFIQNFRYEGSLISDYFEMIGGFSERHIKMLREAEKPGQMNLQKDDAFSKAFKEIAEELITSLRNLPT